MQTIERAAGMQMNRREFLGCLAVGSTLLPLAMPSLAAKTPIHERLGIQLYTVREGLSSDLRGTVEGLKEIGFKEAELCRWLDLPTTARALRDVGITPVGSLFEGAIITGNWSSWEGAGVPTPVPDYGVEHAIEETLDHDLRHVGVAYIFPSERESLDAYRGLADVMNAAGEKCNAAGVRFIYHNHAFEFEPIGGLTPFGILTDRLDSALVGLELDVCWASIGGVDPVELLADFPQFIEDDARERQDRCRARYVRSAGHIAGIDDRGW